MRIRINSVYPHPPASTTFVLNNKRYTSLAIPYQPIFSNSEQITLNPANAKVTESLLGVLSQHGYSVELGLLWDVIRLGKQMFNVELEVDYDDFACNMVDELEQKNRQITVEVLDRLSLTGIIRVIESARMHYVDEDTEEILDALAEMYLKMSNRPQNEKKILSRRIVESLDDSLGSDDSVSEEQIESSRELIKESKGKQQSAKEGKVYSNKDNQKNSKYNDYEADRSNENNFPKNNNKKYQNKDRQYDKGYQKSFGKGSKRYENNYSNNDSKQFSYEDSEEKYRKKPRNDKPQYDYNQGNQKHGGFGKAQSFRSKQSKDSQGKNSVLNTQQMISLAIYGQSTENWRQRSRPSHYKSQEYIRQGSSKVLKPKTSNSKKDKLPAKIYQVPATFTQKRIFSYPHDGPTFKFSQQLMPFSIYIQPENLTIEFNKDYLVLKLESGKSFKRSSKYSFVENGIIGEGVSILLHGLSLIEDGGQLTIKGENQNLSILNQWFYIQQAIIFQLE